MAVKVSDAYQKMEANLRQNLEQEFGEAPFGFDFGILLPALIQLLVDMLKGCFNIDVPESQVVHRIKAKDFWAQYAAKKTARRFSRQEKLHLKLSEEARVARALLNAGGSLEKEEIKVLVEDVKRNAIDFHSAWD